MALLVEGTAAAGQATPLLSNSSRHVLVARCVSTTANLRLTYPDPHSHPNTLTPTLTKVGSWEVTFQPDFTQPTCQGQWCPQFRGADSLTTLELK